MAPVGAEQPRLSGVVAGVLGVVHAFGELGPALVRRGGGLHENGGALDDVRAGPLKRVKNFSFAAASAAYGRSSWADGTAVRGAPPLREEVARPQRTIKGKESTYSSPLSTYSAPGGLRQDPGRAA
jgi:hypothetical protein